MNDCKCRFIIFFLNTFLKGFSVTLWIAIKKYKKIQNQYAAYITVVVTDIEFIHFFVRYCLGIFVARFDRFKFSGFLFIY